MNCTEKTLLVLVSLACLLGARASADTILFQEGVSPTAGFVTPDGGIRSGSQSNNSIGGTLDVGTVSGNIARSLVSFNLLAGLQATDQIGSITLQLTKTRETANFDKTIYVYLVAPFVEGQATWNNSKASTPWTTPGGDFNAAAPLTSLLDTSDSGQTLTFPSTPALVAAAQNALQNQGGVLYLLLAAPDAESIAAYAGFAQGENPTASSRPLLTVTTVIPEPASLSLLGLAGMTVLTRRRGQ